MHNNKFITALSIAIMLVMALTAQAFNPAIYANKSKLASGKWVRIAIPENGVYELTNAELQAMGFSSPQNVRIFGYGGHMLSEKLYGTAPNDMVQVPIKRFNDKICFYANGPVKFVLNTSLSGVKRAYTRTVNAYANYGYYFVTDASASDLLVRQVASAPTQTASGVSTSLDYTWHELELFNKGRSGKDLLGETIGAGNHLTVDFTMPNVVQDSIAVVLRTALNCTGSSMYTKADLHMNGNAETVELSLNSSRIWAVSSAMYYYNTDGDSSWPFTRGMLNSPSQVSENAALEIWHIPAYTTIPVVNNSWLDYFIVTFSHSNALSNNGQVRMGFYQQRAGANVVLPQATSNVEVWNVDATGTPVSFGTAAYNDGTTSGRVFAHAKTQKWGQYVAFDPTATLMKIASYEDVPNQDIHGAETPDMVIVTNDYFLPQAERVAQLHRDIDNLNVLVVTQQQVFNEFSSGTPDAMAIRLMCKMFYDRDKTKFKNLLMFGYGSFDNRNLTGDRKNLLITYETDVSNTEDFSYTSDDFFGILDDDSGDNIAQDMLRLGVGRYTPTSLEEAKNDVDKLEEYLTDDHYGAWRNNCMIASDQFDDGLHEFQSEGIARLCDGGLGSPMYTKRLFVGMYPLDVLEKQSIIEGKAANTATEAKRLWKSYMRQGQYFASYIGHGGSGGLSKLNHMWNNNDVLETDYSHWPIMTLACCDVARYDCDDRGIGEVMFHKRNGGAIALLASARQVYATDNDALNQAFVKALFSYKANGYMPTLGEVYMKSKQSFGDKENTNKMSYMLLGDPALKINYPLPLFDITLLNNTQPVKNNKIEVYPMQELTIEARVKKEDGTLDTDFNGDATITLLDSAAFFATVSSVVNRVTISRDIYYPRNELATITGRVENGIFTGTIVVPKQCHGGYAQIRTYAHREGTTQMVNGVSPDSTIFINPYNEEMATVVDNEAPVIEHFYINEEEQFNMSPIVESACTVHIEATDNIGLNTQLNEVGGAITLLLDGSTSVYEVNDYVTLSNGSRVLTTHVPLDNLSVGRHTLVVNVCDMNGNTATKAIEFFVGSPDIEAALSVEEEPAVQQVTFNFVSKLDTTPATTVKVLDAMGNLVWMQNTSSFPIVWNLNDNTGTRVAPGLYHYFGTFDDGVNYGGTPIGDLIVVDPVKTAE